MRHSRKNLRIDIRSPTTQPSHHFDIPDMALPPSAGGSSAFRQCGVCDVDMDVFVVI